MVHLLAHKLAGLRAGGLALTCILTSFFDGSFLRHSVVLRCNRDANVPITPITRYAPAALPVAPPDNLPIHDCGHRAAAERAAIERGIAAARERLVYIVSPRDVRADNGHVAGSILPERSPTEA